MDLPDSLGGRERELPVVRPDREPITLVEAQRIGLAANRLGRLRALLAEAANSIGSIVVGSGYGAKSLALGSVDIQAALALLIERDELFLASFNVQLERPKMAEVNKAVGL